MTLSFQALLIAYWQTVCVYARSIRYAIDFSTVVKREVSKLQRATQFFRKQSACLSELQSIQSIFNSSQEQAQRLYAVSSRSTIGGGRVCNKFVPVLGKDGTRIAPPGDLIDQPPREIS